MTVHSSQITVRKSQLEVHSLVHRLQYIPTYTLSATLTNYTLRATPSHFTVRCTQSSVHGTHTIRHITHYTLHTMTFPWSSRVPDKNYPALLKNRQSSHQTWLVHSGQLTLDSSQSTVPMSQSTHRYYALLTTQHDLSVVSKGSRQKPSSFTQREQQFTSNLAALRPPNKDGCLRAPNTLCHNMAAQPATTKKSTLKLLCVSLTKKKIALRDTN